LPAPGWRYSLSFGVVSDMVITAQITFLSARFVHCLSQPRTHFDSDGSSSWNYKNSR